MSTRTKLEPQAAEPVGDSLAVKYRPTKLSDVIGQDAIVRSLEKALESKSPAHAFCFLGPSGVGKTTLARIMASKLGCSSANIVEIDAASNSTLEAIKVALSGARYLGFGETPTRAYIIDEAHALSKAAWQATLKAIEEPPAHVFYFFCTTETGKIPETIKTRCQNYTLKALTRNDVYSLVEWVIKEEGLEVTEAGVDMIVRAAGGSARAAIMMAGAINGIRDEKEITRILETPVDNAEVIELCRLLIDRSLTWDRAIETLRGLEDMSAEGVRIVIVNYVAGCLMKASAKQAPRLLHILAAFSKPYISTDKNAPLLLSFGDLLFGD